MSIHKKRQELLRLQQAFELEAAQFHDLSLSVLFMTQQAPATSREFTSPNHAIMLWQYYGELQGEKDKIQFLANLKTSDTQRAGLRGSEFSCFAILEGPRVAHFIKMAKRAASLFSEKEKSKFRRMPKATLRQTVLRGNTSLWLIATAWLFG